MKTIFWFPNKPLLSSERLCDRPPSHPLPLVQSGDSEIEFGVSTACQHIQVWEKRDFETFLTCMNQKEELLLDILFFCCCHSLSAVSEETVGEVTVSKNSLV